MTPTAGRSPRTGQGLDTVPFVRRELVRSGLTGTAILRRAGRRLGWRTVADLLFHLPRRYEDLRQMSQLGDLIWTPEGSVVSARVRVASIRVEPTMRRRVQRTVARVEDDTGEAEATWFGRRYIERRLRPGDQVIVSGRIRRFGRRLTFDNPEFQRDDGSAVLHAGRIVPIYPLTEGLTANRLRAAIREALDRGGRAYPEYLPAPLIEAEGLMTIGDALENVHFPETFETRDRALRRIAFDELLALQLGMVGRRRDREREPARPLAVADALDAEIRAALDEALAATVGPSARLTPDQVAAIEQIRSDLAGSSPMLRLLQGDVGSGKTAVAAWALAAAAQAGAQGALLAPTDLLARQHAASLDRFLAPLGLPVALLTGSLSAAGGRVSREAIATGQAQVVVGTHALFQERVRFADLGLVVIDEQHRFGVEQRAQLEAKAGGRVPHVLLMTATPIPRTLGQVLYADLEVSSLRTPPAGRPMIATGIRRTDELDGTWRKVREEAAAGHRTFVVAPLIEGGEVAGDGAVPGAAGALSGDAGPASNVAAMASGAGGTEPGDDSSAAETLAAHLRTLLAPLRVGLVHGRMKPADRDAEMTRFRDGDLDVLVGTTVLEVGVDVREATMIIVMAADRFGLAQLHQLRGRVGRGTAPSYCVLVSDAADEVARARLRAVVELRDGFALAERDFELRREGNVLGLLQSGLPRLRVASLERDDHRALATAARRHAETILGQGGDLDRDLPRLAEELRTGWLADVASGEASSAA